MLSKRAFETNISPGFIIGILRYIKHERRGFIGISITEKRVEKRTRDSDYQVIP